MKYIGIDIHSSTCTFCVVNERGTELDLTTIETNGRLIISYLRNIDGPKKLAFEECELSQWFYELTRHEADEVVVCNPTANGDYKKLKTDKVDARKIAQLLRGGFLVPVYHDGSERERFRSMMSAYEDLVQEAVRLKSRLKSLFRKNGIRVKGSKIYSDASFLDGLDRADFKYIGAHLYRLLEVMDREREDFVKQIARQSRAFKEVVFEKSIPGIGPIQAAKIVAQVIDPGRFATKYKFFSYCGLVRHEAVSGDKRYGTRRIWGNRILKCVYKMAAHSALLGDNSLKKYYEHLLSKGVHETDACNAVSRKIAAISLSVWRHKKKYDDNQVMRDLTR